MRGGFAGWRLGRSLGEAQLVFAQIDFVFNPRFNGGTAGAANDIDDLLRPAGIDQLADGGKCFASAVEALAAVVPDHFEFSGLRLPAGARILPLGFVLIDDFEQTAVFAAHRPDRSFGGCLMAWGEKRGGRSFWRGADF